MAKYDLLRKSLAPGGGTVDGACGRLTLLRRAIHQESTHSEALKWHAVAVAPGPNHTSVHLPFATYGPDFQCLEEGTRWVGRKLLCGGGG